MNILRDTHWINREKFSLKGRRLEEKVSILLKMEDGVDIGLTYYVPEKLYKYETFPVIFHQTRYYRNIYYRFPFNLFLKTDTEKLISKFISNGYAFVSIDVRGSGESLGNRKGEWSLEERRDALEVLEWILKQKWCDGKIGLYGISYDGTAGEFISGSNHKSIKAVVSYFSVFDIFSDIGFPGGVHFSWFTKNWSKINDSLDSLNLSKYFGKWINLFIKGCLNSKDKNYKQKIITSHKENWDIYKSAQKVKFRDTITESGVALQELSIHNFILNKKDKRNTTKIPLYALSGWWDGAYCRSAINKFKFYTNYSVKLTIGPWDHGGHNYIGDYKKSYKPLFDFQFEVIRFFDFYIKGIQNGISTEESIHYFTIGNGKWKGSSQWPPLKKDLEFYIHPEKLLFLYKPIQDESMNEIRPDSSHSTGKGTRWNSMLNPLNRKIGYNRKKSITKCFSYRTLPFQENSDISGNPELIIFLRSSLPEGDLFVYLDEFTIEGKINYITEGIGKINYLSSTQNKKLKNEKYNENFFKDNYQYIEPGTIVELKLILLPISYTIPKGSSLILSIAGYDIEYFDPLKGDPPVYDIFFGKKYPSRLILPVEVDTK